MVKFVIAIILAIAVGFGLYAVLKGEPAPPPDGSEVAGALVATFGSHLHGVSLTGEPSSIAQAMDEHYASYITRDLLTQWKADPSQAPGKGASGPWPDRIEVSDVMAEDDGSYSVTGTVIEVTSADMPGGISNAYEIKARVVREGDSWKISQFSR